MTTPVRITRTPFRGLYGIIIGIPPPSDKPKRKEATPSQNAYDLNKGRMPLFYHLCQSLNRSTARGFLELEQGPAGQLPGEAPPLEIGEHLLSESLLIQALEALGLLSGGAEG